MTGYLNHIFNLFDMSPIIVSFYVPLSPIFYISYNANIYDSVRLLFTTHEETLVDEQFAETIGPRLPTSESCILNT